MFEGLSFIKDTVSIIAYCAGVMSAILTFIELHNFLNNSQLKDFDIVEKPKEIKQNHNTEENISFNKKINTIYFDNIELKEIQQHLETRINSLLKSDVGEKYLQTKNDLLLIKEKYLPKIIYNYNKVDSKNRVLILDKDNNESIYTMTKNQLTALTNNILEIENLRLEEESRDIKVMSRFLKEKLHTNNKDILKEVEKNY